MRMIRFRLRSTRVRAIVQGRPCRVVSHEIERLQEKVVQDETRLASVCAADHRRARRSRSPRIDVIARRGTCGFEAQATIDECGRALERFRSRSPRDHRIEVMYAARAVAFETLGDHRSAAADWLACAAAPSVSNFIARSTVSAA